MGYENRQFLKVLIENLYGLYYKADFNPTVERFMVQQEFCKKCNQKGDCKEVYRMLGNAEGPPVVAKVCLAFLLPLVVFIVSLGVCDRILAGEIENAHVLSAVCFLSALLVTFTCIIVTKVIGR